MSTKVLIRPKSSHQSGLSWMVRNPHPNKERHGDCGVRSICLALNLPYKKVWDAATAAKRELAPTFYDCWGNERKATRTATWGLSKQEMSLTFSKLELWDWTYYGIARGHTSRKIFHADNFPKHCIVLQANHWVCVKDGAIWDTWDSRGKRPKKIDGYFATKSWQQENFPRMFPS